jgi:hypothetical protein
VTTAQVLPIHLSALQSDVEESSLNDARTYVSTLAAEYRAQQELAAGRQSSTGGVGPSGTIPTLPPSPPPSTSTPSTTAPPGQTPSTTVIRRGVTATAPPPSTSTPGNP